MVQVQYKQFNVYYSERVKDGSYVYGSVSFSNWKATSTFISEMIKDSDPLDPKGPAYKLDRIEAIQ